MTSKTTPIVASAAACFAGILSLACGDTTTEPITFAQGGATSVTGTAGSPGTGGDNTGGSSTTSQGGSGAGEMGGAGGSGGGVGGGGGSSSPLAPRLLVAQASGVAIWNNVDQVTTDVDADTTLGGFNGSGIGLTARGNRLFAASDDATDSVFIYDGAGLVDAASSPVGTIPSASFESALFGVFDMHVDGGDNLWITSSEDAGSTRLFPDASTITGGASQAQFEHTAFQQIYDAVYDPIGDHLFGAQVSGAGLIVFDDPTSAAATVAHDWVLQAGTGAFDIALNQDDLYLTVPGTQISIWRDISTKTMAAAPDVVLDTASSQVSNPFHLFFRGDVLVVTDQDFGSPKIQLFLNASTLTSGATADVSIPVVGLGVVREAYLDASDNLYVRFNDRIVIYDNATTSPTMKTQLVTGVSNTEDLFIIE